MRYASLIASGALIASVMAGLATQHQMESRAMPWRWNLPAHFQPPRVPADNPMSEDKFQLGRRLFYDTRLSGSGTQSCASCHFQHLAFTDGKTVSSGSTGEPTARNAPSIANSAWNTSLTWANYSLLTLERHMLVPLFGENPIELGVDDHNRNTVLQRFRDDRDYRRRFAQVFGPGPDAISFTNIIKAIAAFQRGVTSADSRYDRYLAGNTHLTLEEERGRSLFFSGQAQCSTCHAGYLFSDQTTDQSTPNPGLSFHNTGLYNIDGKGGFPEPNRGILELSGRAEDMGAFRAPSLRNVAVTAPYMHDGSIATLEDVLDHYAAHGRRIDSGPHAGDGSRNPYKDPRIDLIRLNAQEKADLIAFLKTLTDETLLHSPRHANPFQ